MGEELEATVEFKAVPGPLPVRNDAATREGLSTPAVQALVRQARPFAEMLEGASAAEGGDGRGGATDASAGGLGGSELHGGAVGGSNRGAATRTEGAAIGAGRAADAETAGPMAPGLAAAEGEPASAVAAGRPEPRAAAALREGLVGHGVGADLAGEIVDAVVASSLPFANSGRLRTLVRDELALRVPVASAAAPGRRTVAVVGPAGAGKTAAVAGIAIAHAGAGRTVACLAVDPSDGGAALESMLAEANVLVAAVSAKELGRLCGAGKATDAADDQLAAAVARADLVLIDTPAAWAGADNLTALGKALKAAKVDETHLALRAGTAAAVGGELAAGLAMLRPDRLLLTAAAETSHLGGALDVAIRCELPLGYVADGPGSIAPADARALASRVTP